MFAPKLVFVCPSIIASNWNPAVNPRIADLFEGGNIAVRVDANRYTRITEGSSSSFIDFYNAVGVDRHPQRVGFSVKITDTRDELYLALKQLSRIPLATNTLTYSPVTIIDYCRCDDYADYTRGYASRIGMLTIEEINGVNRRGILQCVGGVATESAQLGGFNNGFTVKFMSSNKVLN